jgi:hypothetical protein
MKIIITEEEIKNNSNNDALGELVRKKYWNQLKELSHIKDDDDVRLLVGENGFVLSFITNSNDNEE